MNVVINEEWREFANSASENRDFHNGLYMLQSKLASGNVLTEAKQIMARIEWYIKMDETNNIHGVY